MRPLASVDPAEAREVAREILSDRRYRSDPAPRPFRGPLEWIGDRLRPVLEWIADVLGWVPGWLWPIIAAALVVLVVLWVIRRTERVRRLAAARAERDAQASEDPGALEREAVAAERAGDFERAIRLRFRAGLLRLGARGAIDYRPSVTTTEVRTCLASERFDEVAATFDEVVYGRRPAGAHDADQARTNWPRVLEESSAR